MNSEDTRNLILAIVLSSLVLVGWTHFFAPKYEQNHAAATLATSSQTRPSGGGASSTSGASVPSVEAPVANVVKSKADAIAASERVVIDTSSLSGSIALTGGLIDDIVLKGYRETIDPKSPNITLFSPPGGPMPYWAEAGFLPGDKSVKLPDQTTVWAADSDKLTAERPLTLTYDNGEGLIFTRVISVDDKFMFTMTDSVENVGEAKASLRPYARILRRGRPQVGGYAVLHEGLIGKIGDNSLTELTYANMDKEPGRTRRLEGAGGWLGITDKYWAAAIAPEQNIPFTGEFSAVGSDPVDYQTDFIGEAKTIAPNKSEKFVTNLFAGAKEVSTIDGYQKNPGIRNFELMIDWGWFKFITQPMFRLIDLIYHFVGNFGVAILIVTVLVKAAFFPLANQSYRSMAKMKVIQPQIAALKDLYPDDRQKQQQAQMELFKKEGVNPVAGCLPMLIQIPVFFALYKVIFITIEMRHAPFFGWIKDLSAADPTNVFTLFGLLPWDPTTLPMIGHFLALGIWPLIMGVSMFFQMKMNPEPADPVQKTMFAYMPLIFTFMLGSFPAGLVIYWTWNNTLTILQQSLIMKRAGVKLELIDNLKKMFQRAPPATAPK
jgi:YidC/Oxa1 family membrane protein insertase